MKYFFAHNKLNYAHLIPIYLANLKSLAESDSEIWREFMDGNWVGKKNANPFCAFGADLGLEQINKMMKVSGGSLALHKTIML